MQYRHLAAAGRLPLRLQAVATVQPGHQPTADLETFAVLGLSRALGDDWVRLSGIKVFLDGGRHGALRSSELDLPSQQWGLLTRTPTMLAHEVAAALSQDLQVSIHAIGDLAQRIALGSVEEAVRSVGVTDHRTRIEHFGNERYEPARFEHLAELGLIAVPNPTFLYAEADDPAKRIPPGVEKYVLRSLRAAGLRPPGNSDTAGSQPFATSPWFGVSCMTRRLNRNGVPVSPAEALTVPEAVAAYTSDAAVAGGEEAAKGSIEAGKLADLAVLDRDPFSCPDGELASVTSVLTIVAGRPGHVGTGARQSVRGMTSTVETLPPSPHDNLADTPPPPDHDGGLRGHLDRGLGCRPPGGHRRRRRSFPRVDPALLQKDATQLVTETFRALIELLGRHLAPRQPDGARPPCAASSHCCDCAASGWSPFERRWTFWLDFLERRPYASTS